jgi:beta-N-acetylhexosaminidase
MTQSAVIFGLSGPALTPAEAAFFYEVNPYGYILFARNCISPEQVVRLIDQIKEVTGRDRLPILIDQEGGRVARLKPPHWPPFPPAKLFANLYHRDAEKAERMTYLNARLIAHELLKLGITVDCAPVADVPIPGAHDVIGDRAFGHTPEQVAALARAQARGLMDGGIVPVLKHIPGHGRAHADSHLELPRVDTSLEELRRTDFVPFKALADLPMAMTAHVLFTALDAKRMATLSPSIIKMIREEIGFEGLLMSDDLSMKALGGDFTTRAKSVLAAGCDVVLHCNGDMSEMQAVAKGVLRLDGLPRARAEVAMNVKAQGAVFNVEQARREVEQALLKAA